VGHYHNLLADILLPKGGALCTFLPEQRVVTKYGWPGGYRQAVIAVGGLTATIKPQSGSSHGAG
jgi:hypothetical protein